MVSPTGKSYGPNSKPSKRGEGEADRYRVSEKAQQVIKAVDDTFKEILSGGPSLKRGMTYWSQENGSFVPHHNPEDQDCCDKFIDEQYAIGNEVITDLDLNSIHDYSGPKKKTDVTYYGITPPQIKQLSGDERKKVDIIVNECIRRLLNDEDTVSPFFFKIIYLIEGLGNCDRLYRSGYLQRACLEVIDKT